MSRLLLVDGSSYLHRAYHALPDLRSKDGFPTGAIRGVLSMLFKLQADFPSDHCAAIFDARGKTFRSDWYPEYKANRPPMPEDLAAQVDPLHEAVRLLGWPLLVVAGVEADDVIGTLAARAAEAGFDTLISTGDKDMAQLVDARTTLINTMNDERLDAAGVQAKYGVRPDQIIDWLALMGDTSDNVPGVAKCGPKTAVKWLAEYGTLDALVAHADEIGGKVGENLRAHLPFLPLGKKLVTIRRDLPDLPEVTTLQPTAPDTEALKAFYTRYGFRSFLQALENPGKAAKPVTATPAAPMLFAEEDLPPVIDDGAHRQGYETILDWPTFERWQAKLLAAPLVAVDTETTSLSALEAQLVGISFALAEGEAAYLPLAHVGIEPPAQLPLAEALEKLRPWLESAAHPKVGQNIAYDEHVFANHGLRLAGIAHDTMLESYVLEADRPHDMDRLARRHLGLVTIPFEALCGKGAKAIGFAQTPVDQASEYAAEDADVTLRLHQALYPKVAADEKLKFVYERIELPVREVLFVMERNGIQIDTEVLRAQSHALGLQILDLEQQAYALAGQPFNLGSPKQLAEILFDKLGLPPKKKTPGGAPSTDEAVLSELALDYPLPKVLLEHRSLSKLKSTYTDKLPRMVNPATGRVHTHFSQAVAVTGRLASSDPNLQNIPARTEEGRKIRAAFIAGQSAQIVSADYSQIELRIMAHLSGDANLLDAFAHGEDVHRATAAEIFGIAPQAVDANQRRVAKTINFGLIYGMSAFGLARSLDLTRPAAQSYIDRYFARYPGVKRYMDDIRETARRQGFVETVFGRRLRLPEIASTNAARRQGAERAAINAPMQGTAADIVKLAMVAVQNWLDAEKLESRLLLQVHDELVLEVPDGELAQVRAALPGLMGNVAQLAVPLIVEVGAGPNWEAAH
ncbi:MAG: DNA polymerase I [Zoogloeaceae bacterium]|nr:DNA polymerase I [Zoogloeaceae bacterium]